MKKLLILTLICLSFSCKKQTKKTTTYYLIRHAEKERTDSLNKNPDLNLKGQQRAIKWSNTFNAINFDAIYTTNYKRTIQTAQPTANKQNIKLKFYDANQLYSQEFKKNTTGKTVLVVGHSNTTPSFVNAIIKQDKYKAINDTVNSNLFKVTIINGKINDTLIDNK
ncbi:histidine phosphatase family protein [Olleya aquimaris]|uniref:Histidine phosphatase family protein n=1 Tax=Olleya sediminilitoris TaxID=2795739 RepID=A0ABS1WPS1_9FLAO|nr:histidine phosphatase family protein [Olleya sediminilitoris]AXO78899.1 histidine phosphatase family protein [Olleya aquimaris]MBL7561121.1 histidine phosphatase family protein [Olleya sediminilitoris]